jgi:hypothetical protein
MIECTLCKTQLDPESEGGIAVRILNFMDGSYRHSWDSLSEGQTFMVGNKTVQVVKVRDGWDDGLDSDTSSYSHQGETFDAHVVLKVGDFFYKKSGTGDSYGEVSWDGDFGPVKLTVRTVEVYDFV